MYKWQEPFGYIELRGHIDERGILFEMLRFKDQNIPGQGQIYICSIKPGRTRGNHYHLKKREWFTCAYGEVEMFLKHKDTKKRIKVSATNPKVVYMGPGTYHSIANKGKSIAIVISYSSRQHDPKNNDTFKYDSIYRENI